MGKCYYTSTPLVSEASEEQPSHLDELKPGI